MARQARCAAAGETYHVMARATFGRRLFVLTDDRQYFERRLADVVSRYGWSCLAYCLLGTHYHLLVSTPEANLGEGMHRLNGMYAQAFNDRHDEFGHLFRSRYKTVLVEAEGHFLELFRYIALNPVRAGLCARPSDWRWSKLSGGDWHRDAGSLSRRGRCSPALRSRPCRRSRAPTVVRGGGLRWLFRPGRGTVPRPALHGRGG